MKFKKIEINAFRAFRNKEDGTFDFTYRKDSSGDRVANLVAIYAPNGFGKTSFYDAVEWCMTSRIKRLNNSTDLAKDERQYSADQTSEKNKQYILKNKNAVNKENGEVFIEFEGRNPIGRKTKKLARSDQSDYFPLKKLENSYFRDVILSQEGIDAFLRVDKPEERYQHFVDYFECCKEADRLFKNITQLIIVDDKLLRENKKKSDEKKEEIESKKIPGDIVEQTNELIKNLKKQDYFDLSNLALLNEKYSAKEFNNLTLIVNGYINDINGNTGLIPRLRSMVIEIDRLISELPNYFRAKIEKEGDETVIKESERLLSLFSELRGLKNQQKKNEEKRGAARSELNALLQFEKLKPIFLQIQDDLNSKNEIISELNAKKQENAKRLANITGERETLALELNSIEEDLQKSKSKRDSIDSEFNNYKKNLENKEALINELKVCNKERGTLEEQQKQASLKLSILQRIGKEVSSGMVTDIQELASLFPEIYEKLKAHRRILEESEENLKELKKKVENIHSLKELHDKIISFGKQYIRETKAKKCPLCGEKEYTDFNELLTQIENSTVLSQEYEDIAGKIKKQEDETRKYRSRHEDILKELGVRIDSQMKEIKAKLGSLDPFIFKNRENENRFLQQLRLIDSQIEQYKKGYGDKKIEEIKAELNKKITEVEQKQKTIDKEISEKKELEAQLKLSEIEIQKEIKIANEEIQGAKEDPGFIDYKKLIADYPFLNNFEKEGADDDIDTRIKDYKENLVKNEETIKASLTGNIEVIDKLEKELRQKAEPEVSADQERAKNRLSENESLINLNEGKFKKYLDEIHTDIKTGLESKRKDIGHKLEMFEIINNQLNTLKDQLKYLDDQLGLNKLETELSKLRKEEENLKRVKSKLKENKDRLSAHIEALINDFFEEKLINEIYKRIDPHPEYKDIGFKADLSDKPKLNIYVKHEDKVMSPNLFLSTAQINVLSLSIFLARALKAKDDKGNPIDTIFIDDPIQSMDSINVLSVIDLIRTIIYQHNKQVIVSTHDENFFNLLKKKIPAEFYPAKFIEFETFGKVKTSLE
jgi:exonuclease SbcC